MRLVPYALIALAIYGIPLAVALPMLARKRPRRATWTAFDAAAVLAADWLAILFVTRFVPLWIAAWIVRGAWIAFFAGDRVRQYRQGERMSFGPLPWRRIATLSLLTTFSAMLSKAFSYRYVIWDRDWHIPLVSALRVQRLPFSNVFVPTSTLRYHHLGDVAAAVLQTFSLHRISAALALSLMHDLHLALITITTYAVVRHTGLRVSRISAALFAASVPLAGPMSVLRTPHPFSVHRSLNFCGNGYLGFLTLSYRPHTVVAGFFLVALTGLVVARVAAPPSDRPTDSYFAAIAISCAGALSLLDETSLGIVGVGMGAAWLVAPDVYARDRWRSLAVLVAMAITIYVVTRFASGALAPGGQVQDVELVPWHVLGLYDQPSFIFTKPGAWQALRHDAFPLYAIAGLAIVSAALCRDRVLAALATFFTVVAGLCLFAWMRVVVNADPTESQRFMTAGFFLSPLVAGIAFGRAPGRPILRAAVVVSVSLSALSTVLWYRSFYRETRDNNDVTNVFGHVYATNCRESTGAMNWGSPRLRYVEQAVLYTYSGCQPTLLAGATGDVWSLPIHPRAGVEAIEILDHVSRIHPTISFICAADRRLNDGWCMLVRSLVTCRRPNASATITECPIDRRIANSVLSVGLK